MRSAIASALLLWPLAASAQVAGYPALDNEAIGLMRALGDAVEGPPETYDSRQWSRDLILSVDTDITMSPFRYLIAFSSYAVAQAARQTPAWRVPQQAIFDGYLTKMTQPEAFGDYVTRWGGQSPLGPGNIMYTGHLAAMMGLRQQLFTGPTDRVAVTLTLGHDQWTTDQPTLSALLARNAAQSVDAAGEPIYSIACEPGQVFVACNTPHRVAELRFDLPHTTDLPDTLPQWLAWVDTEMRDSETGLLHDLYYPSGRSGDTTPERHARLSGIYNGWILWYLLALDEPTAREIYPAYTAHFSRSGAASPSHDGRMVILDEPDRTQAFDSVMDLIATGFGLVTARAMGDDALADALSDTWDLEMGLPDWSNDHTTYSHHQPLLPLVFQNSFDLLARTVDTDDPLGLRAPAPDHLNAPTLASISDPRTFVNQAVWDPTLERFIVTVNGGGATTDRVTLEVVGLDPTRDWQVTRDDATYDDWSLTEDVLSIQTQRLSRHPHAFVIAPASAGERGCVSAPGGAEGPWGVAMALWALTRRQRRHPAA